MSAIPHCQVCQLSQNVCHMCLVYGYISNTWHTAGDCYSWKFKYLWFSAKAWTEPLTFISIILKTIPAEDSRNHLSQLCPFYWWGRWVRSWASLRSAAAAASKSLQSCPTLCDPIDGSPPGSSVHGILQARTLEWVAISSSNAWKWKVKVKSLSRVQHLATLRTAAHQAPPSMAFSRQEHWGAIAFSIWGLQTVLMARGFYSFILELFWSLLINILRKSLSRLLD